MAPDLEDLHEKVFEVEIGAISVDSSFQFRHSLNGGTVKSYMAKYAAGEDMPPVKLARRGEGLVLYDGFHRVEALRANGRSLVKAQIIEGLSDEEILWRGAEANLCHGLRPERAEIREAFRAYVRAGRYITTPEERMSRKGKKSGKYKTYDDIHKDLHATVAIMTLHNWMKKDFPRVSALIGGTEPNGKGGLSEEDITQRSKLECLSNIDSIEARCRTFESPEIRGEIIERTRGVLKRMEEHAHFKLPDRVVHEVEDDDF